MLGFLARIFARREPVLSQASPRDAAAIATLHAASFHRGWSEGEIEHLLIDRNVVAHRALAGRRLAGFILSRLIAGEAGNLSGAGAAPQCSRGPAWGVPCPPPLRLPGCCTAPWGLRCAGG